MHILQNIAYFLTHYLTGWLWLLLPLSFGLLGLWWGHYLWARLSDQIRLAEVATGMLRKDIDDYERQLAELPAPAGPGEVTGTDEKEAEEEPESEEGAKAEKKAEEEEVKTITIQLPRGDSAGARAPADAGPAAGADGGPGEQEGAPGIPAEEEAEPEKTEAERGELTAPAQMGRAETVAADGDIAPSLAAAGGFSIQVPEETAEDIVEDMAEETEAEDAAEDIVEETEAADAAEDAAEAEAEAFGPEPELPPMDIYDASRARYPDETTIVKQELGVIFAGRPGRQDDLTQISGIGEDLEAKLNAAGIFRFQQIADWNDYNVWAFNREIAIPGRIESDGWVGQAAGLAAQQAEEEAAAAAPPEEEQAPEEFVAEAPPARGEAPGEPAADFPAEGAFPDLEPIPPIGPTVPPGTAEFKGEAHPAAGASAPHDLPGLIASLFADEDVEPDPTFGILYRSPPDQPDDLQEIWGIGALLENKLNEAGIYKFKQIAHWSDRAVDAFQERLHFPDRIRRDDWVKQARELLEERV